jgi:superfamily II DNA/RNA helicase
MIVLAEKAALRPDARVHWLVQWIKDNMLSGATWNNRRLIIFTEWEDTRRWLEKRVRGAFADSDRIDERIGIFTGATGQDRREEVTAAFNADPAKEPLRILICTDAAREGINLQTWCSDLIVHFDLPWNPSRLEQRNGSTDRKLQPAKPRRSPRRSRRRRTPSGWLAHAQKWMTMNGFAMSTWRSKPRASAWALPPMTSRASSARRSFAPAPRSIAHKLGPWAM